MNLPQISYHLLFFWFPSLPESSILGWVCFFVRNWCPCFHCIYKYVIIYGKETRRVKLKKSAKWLKNRVDIWIHFSSFQCLSGFIFATLGTIWSRQERPRSLYWTLEGSRFLSSWKSQVDWNEHIPSSLGWDFSVEISRVHSWARLELAVPDPWPWWPQIPVGPGSGKVAKKQRYDKSCKREAGWEGKSDFSASTAVREIQYAALSLQPSS